MRKQKENQRGTKKNGKILENKRKMRKQKETGKGTKTRKIRK